MRNALALVAAGVPIDIAFNLNWDELIAWNVLLGEIKSGKTFDWGSMTWPD